MIGTKFAKPLEADTLTREVMRTHAKEVEEQVAYPIERKITHTVSEPVYKTVTTDDGEKIQVIAGYEYKEVTETVQDVEVRTEKRTVTEEETEQEEYDNPAPNTYTKYREAAQWCNANGAIIVDCQPTTEYPNGYYEVQAIPAPSIEDLREAKLAELKTDFKTIRDTAWVMSSLGFKADANDTANTDVEGLIKRMTALGETETLFCDFDNVERNVTLEGLHTLQLEIIMNGQYLYKQKWDIRGVIKATKTKDELEAIEIRFTMMDFTA